MKEKRKSPGLAAFGFLLPNLLGFLGFTVVPVLFSLWMAFTNWNLKPAVELEFVGLRNFNDLIGARPIGDPSSALLWGYVAAVIALCVGAIGALWANMADWRGTRLGGVILSLTGLIALIVAVRLMSAPAGVERSTPQGTIIAGLIAIVCGIALMCRDGEWRPGLGTVPAALIGVGALCLWQLNAAMWLTYEPRDARFWQYLYNTVYLMLGIPFGIGGSLVLAMLVNNELPLGRARPRIIGAALCLACGVATLALVWALGHPNIALLGAIFWLIVALGVAFNVVSFRTIYYLPAFTAGVALMILWKALYNPETGPINVALRAIFNAIGSHAQAPEWLASVEWAKPALIIMGVWIGIGGTNMLLYLAGLSNVPRELLDAAEVDGATPWQRFRHVIWPQLAPTTFFITIMSVIGGLQGGFEQARVMTGGGPAGSTTTLSYYIYNKAFQDLDLGYAAAISWVLFAIIFIATALNWKFGRELEVGE